LNTNDKETSIETEQEDSTYFSSKRLLKICSACDAISSIFLILAVLVFVFGVWLVVQTLAASVPLDRLIVQAVPVGSFFCIFHNALPFLLGIPACHVRRHVHSHGHPGQYESKSRGEIKKTTRLVNIITKNIARSDYRNVRPDFLIIAI